MILYHVSYDIYQDKRKLFVPRVPSSRESGEDDKIERICFADSVLNCLRGKEGFPRFDGASKTIRVYECEINEADMYLLNWKELHEKRYVKDASLTHEYWYLKPIYLDSKLIKIYDIRKSMYYLIDMDYLEHAVSFVKKLGVGIVDIYNINEIINKLVKNADLDVIDKIKSFFNHLCHMEYDKDVGDPEEYKAFWGRYPRQNIVNDYEELELIDGFVFEEIVEMFDN